MLTEVWPGQKGPLTVPAHQHGTLRSKDDGFLGSILCAKYPRLQIPGLSVCLLDPPNKNGVSCCFPLKSLSPLYPQKRHTQVLVLVCAMIGGHKVLDVLRALTPPRAELCDVEAAEQGAPTEHGEVEDAAAGRRVTGNKSAYFMMSSPLAGNEPW